MCDRKSVVKGRTKWALVLVMALATLSVRGSDNATPGDYRLDYRDRITVTVLRHKDYCGEYTVPTNGKVVFPGVGELELRGKTLEAVRAEIAGGLSSRLKSPEVFVTLALGRPQLVYVIGMVANPSALPIEPDWRVSEALAAAGGLKIKPERTRAFLFRTGAPDQKLDLSAILQDGKAEANTLLEPGDTISVQEAKVMRIFIAGQVNNPGDYDVDTGLGAVEAIAKAGGCQSGAAISRSVIYRGENAIPLNLFKAMVEGVRTANIALQSNDVVLVPPNHRRFAVLGEVNAPGWFDMIEGREMTLSDAISRAGNVTRRGITTYIAIIRNENGKLVRTQHNFQSFLKDGKADGNSIIRDGDVVFVPETKRLDLGHILGGLASLSFLSGLSR